MSKSQPLEHFRVLHVVIAGIAFAPLAMSQYDYTHPVTYAPEVYVCYKTQTAPVIDGIISDTVWAQAPWTSSFVDIEGDLKPLPEYDTRVKMLWDNTFFYIGAKLEDRHIWATLRQRDTIVFMNNDFEIFIDPDGSTHNYIELEVNALNTVWDLFLPCPYRDGRSCKANTGWDIDGLHSAVHIAGTINNASDKDTFWSVEIAIPWESIIEFAPGRRPPGNGEQWRVNFSRVAWHVDMIDGRYRKKADKETGKVPYFPQENWVWSPQGHVDMHRPETWGYVQFSDHSDSNRQVFEYREDEKIKWALRRLYYQQRICRDATGRYQSNPALFTMPDLEIDGYSFSLEIEGDDQRYTISAPGFAEQGYWHIREDGKIWFEQSGR